MATTPLQIAIDGPIGSGKSTVAREIARRLGLTLVDSGAFFRTATYIALRDHLPPTAGAIIAQRLLAAKLVQREPTAAEQDGRKVTILLDGRDVSWEIRTYQIDGLVAKVSRNKEVIGAVHRQEEKLITTRGVVIEGRDIGINVLPNAAVKIYLTAQIKKRVQRRFKEYQRRGDHVSQNEIVKALRERDELDMRRPHAPLRKARGAKVIDTTNRTVDEVVETILKLVPEESKVKFPAAPGSG